MPPGARPPARAPGTSQEGTGATSPPHPVRRRRRTPARSWPWATLMPHGSNCAARLVPGTDRPDLAAPPGRTVAPANDADRRIHHQRRARAGSASDSEVFDQLRTADAVEIETGANTWPTGGFERQLGPLLPAHSPSGGADRAAVVARSTALMTTRAPGARRAPRLLDVSGWEVCSPPFRARPTSPPQQRSPTRSTPPSSPRQPRRTGRRRSARRVQGAGLLRRDPLPRPRRRPPQRRRYEQIAAPTVGVIKTVLHS